MNLSEPSGIYMKNLLRLFKYSLHKYRQFAKFVTFYIYKEFDMTKNQCTSSKDGVTFTTLFNILENSPPIPSEERRHQEIQKELRNISNSIDGLCIVAFLIGVVFLFKGCAI